MNLRRAVWLAAAASVAIAGAAQAQLGETQAQIARRYGAPVQHHARVREHQIIGGPSTVGDVYRKDGLYIRIVYGPEVSVQAEFSRCEGELLRSQAEAILAGAAEGSKWQAMPGGGGGIAFYRRADGQALASWTSGANGSLLIASDDSGAVWQKLLSEAR